MNNIYTKEFVKKAKLSQERGINIYALTNRFYKLSKLNQPIPEEVLEAVLDEFEKRKDNVSEIWPYFLRVLENKSAQHFSNKSAKEGENYKKERANSFLIGNIMRNMQ